ncbi:hypothetical protein BN1708_002594, partial [Verticillium longisporum]
ATYYNPITTFLPSQDSRSRLRSFVEMHYLTYLNCLAAVAAASPLAVVEPANIDGSTFTLRQVENKDFAGQTGLDELVWAYIKYNAELPAKVREAIVIGKHVNARFKGLVQRGTTDDKSASFGTVQAFPPRNVDIQYVVPVQIGSPPQTVFLNLDTGSGDLWTFSSETPEWQRGDHRIYSPELSNTSVLQDGLTWRITYGDGSGASGNVYNDRVALGKTSFAAQAVESASQVSPSFTRDSFASGILGLGFGRGNTVKPRPVKTYFENVMPALASPVFTSNLQAGRPGNYNFGFVARNEYTGRIGYTAVTKRNPYWEIKVDGTQIGGGEYNKTTTLDRVIVDTGTTLLMLPDEHVDAYYDQVEGARFSPSWAAYLFPCDATLPDWTFGLGDYRGKLPGRYVRYNQVNETHCFGGIQSSAGIPFAIFGAALLKAQFAVFDYVHADREVQPRVGFANKPLR